MSRGDGSSYGDPGQVCTANLRVLLDMSKSVLGVGVYPCAGTSIIVHILPYKSNKYSRSSGGTSVNNIVLVVHCVWQIFPAAIELSMLMTLFDNRCVPTGAYSYFDATTTC